MIRTGRVAEGRTDAPIAFRGKVCGGRSGAGLVPRSAGLEVEPLRGGFGQAVGERLHHDRRVVVTACLVTRGEIVGAVDRNGERAEVVARGSDVVRETAVRP